MAIPQTYYNYLFINKNKLVRVFIKISGTYTSIFRVSHACTSAPA